MILTKRQANRFERLYAALCAFTIERGGLPGSAGAMGARKTLTDDDYINATACLWAGDGHPDFIRDFVRENPARLGRADLREAESWVDGLLARFDVFRDGGDTVFTVGDFGFAVRSAGVELDRVTDLPACLETVLLPFDGLITFGAVLDDTDCEDGQRLEEEGTEMVARMRAGRTLARSARDYMRIVGDAREEYRRLARERYEGLTPDFADLGYGDDHADLEDYADKYCDPPYQHAKSLAEGLEKGEPTTSLAEVLRAHDASELMGLLARTGSDHDGDVRDDDLEGLVETLLETYRPSPRDIICQALACGSWHVIDLLAMVEEDGPIRCGVHDMDDITNVPKPIFPFIQVFEVDGDYVATMPDEIRAILAEADWDEAADLVAKHELALSHLESELDFRGVIERDEAIDHLISELPYDVGPAMREPLAETVTWCLREMVSVVETDDDHATYFVCEDMEEMLDPVEGVARDRFLIDSIICAREGIEPRHVDDMPEYATVGDHVFKTPEWNRLAAYLVYHGMAGADTPYSFVFGELVNEIVSATRFSDDAEEVVRDVIEDFGGDASGDEADRLIKALVRALPRWSLNGWAAADLER